MCCDTDSEKEVHNITQYCGVIVSLFCIIKIDFLKVRYFQVPSMATISRLSQKVAENFSSSKYLNKTEYIFKYINCIFFFFWHEKVSEKA